MSTTFVPDHGRTPTNGGHAERETADIATAAGAGHAAPPAATKRNPVARPLDIAADHWLLGLNTSLGLFIGGALAAPLLAAAHLAAAADWLYTAYHLTCHQWAFRSFFLLARTPARPVATYSQDELLALGRDPFGFTGTADLGWKVAICERDLAIYAGLLIVGLTFARRRHLPTVSMLAFVALCLPMALDGFTQLFGWRESTWQLRVLTGLLCGLGSGWFVLPYLAATFDRHRPAPAPGEPWSDDDTRSAAYAADDSCNPSPLSTHPPAGSAAGQPIATAAQSET